jgi:hypothetical protein
MPSTYLYLNPTNRSGSKWLNLPKLSDATRECYLSVSYARVVLEASNFVLQGITIKMKAPVLNYTASNNDDVVVAMLNFNSTRIFTTPDAPAKISLLTNDNLKNIEFVLATHTGANFTLGENDSLEVMFELNYIDQGAMVSKYKAEMPMRL